MCWSCKPIVGQTPAFLYSSSFGQCPVPKRGVHISNDIYHFHVAASVQVGQGNLSCTLFSYKWYPLPRWGVHKSRCWSVCIPTIVATGQDLHKILDKNTWGLVTLPIWEIPPTSEGCTQIQLKKCWHLQCCGHCQRSTQIKYLRCFTSPNLEDSPQPYECVHKIWWRAHFFIVVAIPLLPESLRRRWPTLLGCTPSYLGDDL